MRIYIVADDVNASALESKIGNLSTVKIHNGDIDRGASMEVVFLELFVGKSWEYIKDFDAGSPIAAYFVWLQYKMLAAEVKSMAKAIRKTFDKTLSLYPTKEQFLDLEAQIILGLDAIPDSQFQENECSVSIAYYCYNQAESLLKIYQPESLTEREKLESARDSQYVVLTTSTMALVVSQLGEVTKVPVKN